MKLSPTWAPFETEIVVNAAGQWGGEVGKMVGLNLPVVPMAHLYIITKPIEGVGHDFPTLRDPDLLVYWREEVGGLVTGGYERNPAPFGLNGIPRDFKYQLLPPDWERFTPLMENSIKRVPAVETAEVIQLLNGPEGFTPDGEFLLGPTSVKGFWVACAFCAHGSGWCRWDREDHGRVDHRWAPGVGRLAPGCTSLRFELQQPGLYRRPYHRNLHPVLRYSLPGEERLSRRGLRLSPTYNRLQALGLLILERRPAGNAPTGSNLTKRKHAMVMNPKAGLTTTGRVPSVMNI